MYSSLSKYIERLEDAGELVRISVETSSIEEIAELTDREAKSEGGGRALLFERTGTAFPVVTNIMGSERRLAMALGVDKLSDIHERLEALVGSVLSPKESLLDKMRMLPLLSEAAKWFPRKIKGRGACQQVVLKGEEAKLSLLPILKCWPHDGGRFITLPMVNTIDPDSKARNVGMYRMQVFDEHTTGMHWHRHKTGARHYEAYKARGERMPVSVALGGDPIYTYCATAPMPDNMDEYLLAGMLRKKPVHLVKCLTNDIYVPEDCDFVIEGYVDPSEDKVVEGDFGDHTGFYSLTDLYPKFHVTAITHRHEAIYPATIVGIPPQEDAYISRATETIFLTPIRLVMQPEIEDMSMPSAGTSHNIAIVTMRSRYIGQSDKVAAGLWGAGQMMFNKYLVLAPSGYDIRSKEAMASLLRRCNPAECTIRSNGVYDVLDHATPRCGYGGKLALDLTGCDALSERHGRFDTARLPDGCVGDDRFVDEWGLAIVYAAPEAELDKQAIAEAAACNFIVIFDHRAEGFSGYDLLWLAAANTEPQRDIELRGESMLIDARPKPANGSENPSRWPNIVTASEATIAKVDGRWSEYGLGEWRESPSVRYAKLALSNKAEW